MMGQAPMGYHTYQQPMMGTDMIDPNIMKKGLEDLREQIRDLHKDAILTENDLEKRRNDMILR